MSTSICVLDSPQYSRLRSHIEVDLETGCWNWTSTLNHGGYGQTTLHGGGRKRVAHRIVFEIIRGPVPEGLTLDHLCRNKTCVNPDHLEPVSLKENILRGDGITAKQARQVYCKRGHLLAGDNVKARPSAPGERSCLTCERQYDRDRRRKRREARAVATVEVKP